MIKLYQAHDLKSAFKNFENEALSLGFDGTLYTYIPQVLIASNFIVKPRYQVSDGYSPEFLKHYIEAEFERYDPLIQMVVDGVSESIDWWGSLCESYKQKNRFSREVIDMSRTYGIQHGTTIPLMSDTRGVAFASLISRDAAFYLQPMNDKLQVMILKARLFNSLVMSSSDFMKKFVQPVFSTFSDTQLYYVNGLASGKKTTEIAMELGTSAGYLEQTMLKLRRKISGVQEFEAPIVTRNEVLYIAGLLNLRENSVQSLEE